MFSADNLYKPKRSLQKQERWNKVPSNKDRIKECVLRQQTATNNYVSKGGKHNIIFTVICDLENPFRAIGFCLGRCEKGTTKTKYECNISCINRDFVD